jgi:4-hydroxythreonine-4-phosphate dehydrogenase
VKRPRVGITLGDPSGIGTEVTLKALKRRAVRAALTPVLFGDASTPLGDYEMVVVSQLKAADRRPGKPTKLGGAAQFAYLTAAIDAAKSGEVQALCTAPVSKEGINRAGLPFVGHTEVLARAFDCDVLMMMAGPQLRVALATNHVPIHELSQRLTKSGLVETLVLLSRTLGARLGKKRPSIAVCGLNPHASDGGVLGEEEARTIAPAVEAARKLGLNVHGPFAADGLFAKARHGFPYDVALAMFHDQGLVATKTLDFERTVNVTLGLPVPRTSPDHGVAYDIAGKDKADDAPMVHALLEAARFVG